MTELRPPAGILRGLSPQQLSDLAAATGRIPLAWQTGNAALTEYRAAAPEGEYILSGTTVFSGTRGRPPREWTLTVPGVEQPLPLTGISQGRNNAQFYADHAHFRRKAEEAAARGAQARACTHGADCPVHPDAQQLHDRTPTTQEILELFETWAVANGQHLTRLHIHLTLIELGLRKADG